MKIIIEGLNYDVRLLGTNAAAKTNRSIRRDKNRRRNQSEQMTWARQHAEENMKLVAKGQPGLNRNEYTRRFVVSPLGEMDWYEESVPNNFVCMNCNVVRQAGDEGYCEDLCITCEYTLNVHGEELRYQGNLSKDATVHARPNGCVVLVTSGFPWLLDRHNPEYHTDVTDSRIPDWKHQYRTPRLPSL